MTWSAEFSNGSPYLLSLGMSKPLMSLVWLAGPLSGSIGQPIIGVLSDKCTSRFGRRRPFIVAGAAATIVSLTLLSWSQDIILFLFGEGHVKLQIATASFLVYLLDFSIATIQASARAFIVDLIPSYQQQDANAWAAKMTGIGNMIGFVLASANLPHLLPFLGRSQFEVLSACASLGLIACVSVTVYFISERNPQEEMANECLQRQPSPPNDDGGDNDDESTERLMNNDEPENEAQATKDEKSILGTTIYAITHLSPVTKNVCWTQFFAWIGYFPMMFYTSTYVGEFCPDPTSEEAVRKGSFALLLFAITSLVGNFILPYLVEPKSSSVDSQQTKLVEHRVARLWTFSHILFAVCMFATFFVSTANQASALIAVLGVCWAIALWAPFCLIAYDTANLREIAHASMHSDAPNDTPSNYVHQPGIVLGIHNLFVAAPQVISSLMSSILFALLNGSVAWVFRFGGVFAVVAAILSYRLN